MARRVTKVKRSTKRRLTDAYKEAARKGALGVQKMSSGVRVTRRWSEFAEGLGVDGYDPLPHEHGIYIVKLGSVVCGVLDGSVIPYEHNRGDCALSKVTSNRVMDNFHIWSLGQPTFTKKGCNLVFSDSHSRIDGVIRGLSAGKINPSVLDSDISIQIHPEADEMDVYTNMNSTKSHTPRQKATNPHLACGSLLIDLKKRLKPGIISYTEGFCAGVDNNIQYAYYSLHKFGRDHSMWKYSNVFGSRKDSLFDSGVRNGKKADLVPLSSSDMDILVAALLWYCDFRVLVKEINDKTGKNKLKSGPVCGFLLTEMISRLIKGSPLPSVASVVKRAERLMSNLVPLCPILTASSIDCIDTTSLKIHDILFTD